MGQNSNASKGNSCFKFNILSTKEVKEPYHKTVHPWRGKGRPKSHKKKPEALREPSAHPWSNSYIPNSNGRELNADYDQYTYNGVCKEGSLTEYYYGNRIYGKKAMIRMEAEKIRIKAYTPEHRLMLAVLHKALCDCELKNEEKDKAEIWFEVDGSSHLFSFEMICVELDLSTTALREQAKQSAVGGKVKKGLRLRS